MSSSAKSLIRHVRAFEGVRRLVRHNSTAERKAERLVILGTLTGFKLLRGIDSNQYDVVVISPRNHFVFTPLLASTTVGTLEFRAITEPVRRANKNITYYQAWCDDIDLKKGELLCTAALPGSQDSKFTIPFDRLVIATGSYANTFNIPGVAEHAFFLKEVEHARKIRARILEGFERASEPRVTEQQQRDYFAVVGGGPTGIEFAGEYLITEDLRKIYPELMDKVQITVFDVAEKILGTFDAGLSEYATKRFLREGIQIRTKAFINEITKDEIRLKDGQVFKYGALIWSTGLTANPLTKSLEVSKDGASRILTDGYLRVLDKDGNAMEKVFAMGDCAAIKDQPYFATAQMATQKGNWLGNYLNKLKVHEKTGSGVQPFKYQHFGSTVYISSWNALWDLHGSTSHAVKSVGQLRGKLAWILWRSAYLTQSVGLRNKVLIPVYWLFGRDISKF
ncbi:FAD/NAD(P)-binding domain-containing protein [Cladochytrium replicatum]|nr:FAD/NAD(P)-binding domain-containing protein [Cladochytrium replicatum]